MGWFSRDKDDESIIEVSNDNGDHVVIHVPTSEVESVEKELKRAGCEKDQDDARSCQNREAAKREYDRRDHDQHRYRSARVVDEEEDLEDSYDRELDASDYEADENPAWRWWK